MTAARPSAGSQTLGVRLKHLEQSALTIANWLKARPEIALVLHPALPDCPGHDIWKRDFTGSASVFSIVFKDDVRVERIVKFVEALKLFKIGYSWGGVTSLVMAYASSADNTVTTDGTWCASTSGWKKLRILSPIWSRHWGGHSYSPASRQTRTLPQQAARGLLQVLVRRVLAAPAPAPAPAWLPSCLRHST